MQDKCAATRNFIANYTLNIKLTKAHLLNLGSAPEFLDSEWRSILSGLAVNLNIVFSGRYSTKQDPKITHKIGDFTILTQETMTSKAVKTARDWFITWNQAVATTVFTFLIVKENARIMGNISSTCSLPSPKSTIISSSTMTVPFKSKLHCSEMSYSQTCLNLETCTSNIWMSEEPTWDHKCKQGQDDVPPNNQMTHVCNGIEDPAHRLQTTVSTTMSAPTSIALTMSTPPVQTNQKQAQIVGNVAKLIGRPQSFSW